ncbi:HpsJ family protein [Leptolyngbya sp. GB1-A1]|uniref:HpsJ family protein n=1 Tax=Leptolyngbya sp. GB1-A1 TaxID=2933908 RepID=UPI003297A33D
MKAALSPLSPPAYAALILKLVGGLMVIGSIVDCLILVVPPNFLDQVWLTMLIRDWVLRGTIPLIGFALLLLGAWIDVSAGGMPSGRPAGKKRKPAKPRWFSGVVFLSCCYSVLFALLAPLYFNSSRIASAATTRQLNEQAKQAEQELSDRLSERREQINLLLSDAARRREIQAQLEDTDNADNPLRSQLLPGQQTELQQLLELTERVQDKPQLLEQELAKAKQTGIEQIKTQQQQERDRITTETRKLRIHTILTALTLASGYGVIAWTGMGAPQKNQKKRQARSRVQPKPKPGS